MPLSNFLQVYDYVGLFFLIVNSTRYKNFFFIHTLTFIFVVVHNKKSPTRHATSRHATPRHATPRMAVVASGAFQLLRHTEHVRSRTKIRAHLRALYFTLTKFPANFREDPSLCAFEGLIQESIRRIKCMIWRLHIGQDTWDSPV